MSNTMFTKSIYSKQTDAKMFIVDLVFGPI